MVRLADIHPMTGFLRDHKSHLDRLAATGRPEVLTVNGTARVIVQDIESYQKLLDALDAARTEAILRERLASLDRGERGIPASKVLSQVKRRLGLQKRK
jgi:hypothetical protein